MLYVLKIGGKQYKVVPGQVIDVEKINADVNSVVKLESSVVSIFNDKETVLKQQDLEKAVVEAEIVDHFKGDKVIIFKMRRRKNSRRKKGHRQNYTKIKILSVKN